MTGTGWTSRALCSRFPDINFIPDPFLGETSAPAKAVCAHCSVVDQCRAFRVENPQLGVWGGENEVDYLVRRGVLRDPTCQCGKGTVVTTVLGSVCIGCGEVTG